MALKTDIGVEYLDKYSAAKIGRELPSLTIARLMYNENIQVFKDLDDARSVIRRLRGQMGKANKDKMLVKRFFTEAGSPGNFMIPRSEEVEYEPVYLKYKNIGIISDVHVPYHNEEALECALKGLYERKIDCLLINADLIDCYQMSRYIRDPRKRNMKFEIDCANELLDNIQDSMPGVKIYLKIGNHEERIEHYLFTKAPELLGFPFFEMDELLHAKERGMEVVRDKRIIYAGKLAILHGHELNSAGNSVNPARGTFLRTNQSCLIGHCHRTSEHTETRLDGDIITTWSTGCLSELHPDYARINRWNHGFAQVLVGEDGDYKVHNIRIWKGKEL